MKGVAIFLADGFEDMEAVAPLDILRRGGVDVSTVSMASGPEVRSSHGLTVVADRMFADFLAEAEREGTAREDVMIFPGGLPGARHLAEHAGLMGLMQRHYAAGGTVAAICAAPGLVVSQLEPLAGVRFTCYNGFEELPQAKGAEYLPEERVVTDGRLITGRGPGVAVSFGLAILAHLKGDRAAECVKDGLLL